MNVIKIKASMLVILWTSLLPAVMGCLDNSEHLMRKYDSKNWHYVECYCPCKHLINHGTQCKDCGHKLLLPRLIEQVDSPSKKYTGSLGHYPRPEQVIKKLSLKG